MKKDELITKQQIEIEELKEKLKEINLGINTVHGIIYSRGSPLNDNFLKFTFNQLTVFQMISDSLNLLSIDRQRDFVII